MKTLNELIEAVKTASESSFEILTVSYGGKTYQVRFYKGKLLNMDGIELIESRPSDE